jgi:hypothetical protein
MLLLQYAFMVWIGTTYLLMPLKASQHCLPISGVLPLCLFHSYTVFTPLFKQQILKQSTKYAFCNKTSNIPAAPLSTQ